MTTKKALRRRAGPKHPPPELLFRGHGWDITLESAPLPDGRVKTFARAQRSDTVHIIALLDATTMVLLREFRPHFGGYVWTLPGGKVDPGDDAPTAAQKELREEAGFRAAALKPLWTCHHAEALRWTSHIFEAKGLTPDPLPRDANELIEVHLLPISIAAERVLSGANVHTTSAYAILRYMRERA